MVPEDSTLGGGDSVQNKMMAHRTVYLKPASS